MGGMERWMTSRKGKKTMFPLTLYLLVSSADNLCKQFWTQIRPDKTLKKLILKKISSWQKSMQNYPVCNELTYYKYSGYNKILTYLPGNAAKDQQKITVNIYPSWCTVNWLYPVFCRIYQNITYSIMCKGERNGYPLQKKCAYFCVVWINYFLVKYFWRTDGQILTWVKVQNFQNPEI